MPFYCRPTVVASPESRGGTHKGQRLSVLSSSRHQAVLELVRLFPGSEVHLPSLLPLSTLELVKEILSGWGRVHQSWGLFPCSTHLLEPT